MSSRGGRHRLHRRARQELRMRPGRRRRAGLRATARAVLTAAVGLLLAGGGGAVLHNNEVPVPVSFATDEP